MGKQKTYNFNFDLGDMQSIKTSKPGISKSKDNGHDPRPQNSAISKTEELSGYLAGTINNLEVNDQDSDIWDKIINTVKEPFNLAAKAGQEIGTGKYFEGALDAVTAGLHGIMLPFTVPYTGAKAEIERQGAIYQPGVEDNIGKKITSGMDKVMGLPFEVIGNYLETTKEEMAKYGVTPETLEKYMGISPELDKKITGFLTEIGGLFLLKLVHGGIKELKPKGEIPVEIKSTEPSKLGEVENAIKEGEVEQNNIPQRKEVGGGGLPTEASGSNIIKESGKIEKEVTESSVVAPGETRPKYYGRRNKPIKGTGKTKTRGLAKTTEATTIEKGLIDKFENMPEYNVLENKQQMAISSELIVKDFARAKRIALGEEKSPNNVLPEFIYKGVELEAINKGDIGTLRELATSSKLTTEATVMGQRIQALRNQDPLSPVDAIRDIIKTREERITRGRDITEVKEQNYTQIRKQIRKNAPQVGEWQNFIASIRC